MAYTRKNIKNLTGGVSQQPDSERFDNQCTEQINFLSDPIKGLSKRAGTNYVQLIEGGSLSALQHPSKNTFTHVINRSSSEQLLLVIGYDGVGDDATPDIQLLKLNEETNTLEQMVLQNSVGATLSDSDLNYLDVSNSHETHPYSAVTIADYTFIANKDETVALSATAISGGSGHYERDYVKRGLIFIKSGAYSAGFTVKATDSEGTIRTIKLRTSSGSSGPSTLDIRTDMIAGAIHQCLNAQTDAGSNIAFDTSTSGSYTDDDTNIRMYWEDDNSWYIWNAYSQGSNYDGGYASITGIPANEDTLVITGCASGNPVRTFEFTTDGSVGSTGGTAHIAVTVGSTNLANLENLATAINANSALLGLKAFESRGWKCVVHSTIAGSYNAAARGGNMTLGVNSAGVLAVVAIGGAVVDAGDAGDRSTAPVRNMIYFDRQLSGASPETGGSVIAWYAPFLSKAEADASSINVEITDTYGDTMAESFNEVTDKVSGLPTIAPNNYLLKIEGDVENDADDHYIQFELTESGANKDKMGKGKWKESLATGVPYYIDPNTMPHQLIKVDSTTYKFQAAAWGQKTVGDENSDAAPSFIGEQINDLFFYKSRLGILAGESVILSELDNAYNFWRTSVIDSVDSDRIDITSSVNEITYLNWAVPFANQLVIFSDRAQFLLTQGVSGLTPATAALSLGSSYENSTIARPVVNDNTIIFAQEKSGASAVYEMYPTGSTDLGFEAVSISEHIPSYISGKIVSLEASSLSSTVVARTGSDDNALYVYKYYNQGKTRVQSAWSKYELACDYIKGGHFISDKFHIIEGHHISSGTTISSCYWILTYMKFDNTDSLTSSVDLHFNVPSADVNNSGSDTVLTMDNSFDIRDNAGRKGKIVAFNKTDNTSYAVADSGATDVVTLTGVNLETSNSGADRANIAVGLKFDASYEFSKQYIKRGSSSGKEVAVTDGRTTNKWVEIYFNDTQHLTATVSFPTESDFRASSVKTYTGSFGGGGVIGDQPSETSTLRTSVAARNDLPKITLSSGTHQTVTITGATFELMHTSRTSRTS